MTEDTPTFTFSRREKRGDAPCLNSKTLRKIAEARYGKSPEWNGPVSNAIWQHRMAQVQLMIDAIETVIPDMASAVQYAISVERRATEADVKLLMIQQFVDELYGFKKEGDNARP